MFDLIVGSYSFAAGLCPGHGPIVFKAPNLYASPSAGPKTFHQVGCPYRTFWAAIPFAGVVRVTRLKKPRTI